MHGYEGYIVIASLLLLAIVAIAMRPSTFTCTRTLVMPHPAAKIFPHVNNLRKWHDWSPWAKIDPACKTTFEGNEEGPGAIMKWDGNRHVGTGKMSIVASRASTRVELRLEFILPFKGVNETLITFTPEKTAEGSEGTLVNWTMTGRNNFFAKIIGLFMDCDKMIGDKFDEGLDNLDETVAAETAPPAAKTA